MLKFVCHIFNFYFCFMLFILSFDYFFWWPSLKKYKKSCPPPLTSKRPLQNIYKKNLNVCWQLLHLTRIYSSFQVNGICMFRSTKHKVSSNQQPVTWEDGTRYSDQYNWFTHQVQNIPTSMCMFAKTL